MIATENRTKLIFDPCAFLNQFLSMLDKHPPVTHVDFGYVNRWDQIQSQKLGEFLCINTVGLFLCVPDYPKMVWVSNDDSPGNSAELFVPKSVAVAGFENHIDTSIYFFMQEFSDFEAVAFDYLFLDDFAVCVENTDSCETKVDI